MADKGKSSDQPDPTAAFRDAAERSVDQARKAFDDVMALAHKTVAGAETTQQQVQDRMREMTRETLDFAGASAAATLDLVEKLSRARSPQEAMEIQKAYLETQMERLGQQARSVGDGAIRAAQDLTKPFER
jgi:phasin